MSFRWSKEYLILGVLNDVVWWFGVVSGVFFYLTLYFSILARNDVVWCVAGFIKGIVVTFGLVSLVSLTR